MKKSRDKQILTKIPKTDKPETDKPETNKPKQTINKLA